MLYIFQTLVGIDMNVFFHIVVRKASAILFTWLRTPFLSSPSGHISILK